MQPRARIVVSRAAPARCARRAERPWWAQSRRCGSPRGLAALTLSSRRWFGLSPQLVAGEELSVGSHGAFAIKVPQIRENRWRAMLTEQSGVLPALVRAVIH